MLVKGQSPLNSRMARVTEAFYEAGRIVRPVRLKLVPLLPEERRPGHRSSHDHLWRGASELSQKSCGRESH